MYILTSRKKKDAFWFECLKTRFKHLYNALLTEEVVDERKEGVFLKESRLQNDIKYSPFKSVKQIIALYRIK